MSSLVAIIFWVCVAVCINVCQCIIVIEDVYMGDVRVMLHIWEEVCLCLHCKDWPNSQKCSDLGCCPSIRASLSINRYFGAAVGPAKLGHLSQMHAVCVLFIYFFFIMET